jgi:hypothetical protein
MMSRRIRSLRGWFALAFALALLGSAQVALALDRIPVAVVWMGDAASLEEGAQRTVDEINGALSRSRTARPIDGSEDRRVLVAGGPSTKVQLLLRSAEASFVKLRYADAARDYEAAEQILLEEVPFSVEQSQLADVERNLLACYDQLGRSEDAARAAERLSWTAGEKGDMQRLLDKHFVSRAWAPALAPVAVSAAPPGAIVYRNLQPVGPVPQTIAGGDPKIDVLDVEAPGYRRVHRALGAGEPVSTTLAKEDRLGVMVDRIRALAPDAPPAEVALLGKRVGAKRVLVLLPDGPKKLLGRYLDVQKGAWAAESARVDSSGAPAMEKLALYAAPPEPAGPPPTVVATLPPPPAAKSRLGVWGKWYTWVAAGGMVALVATVLIVRNVGSDSLNVTSSH